MIDVSPAISRLSKTVTHKSYAPGSYDAGGNSVVGGETAGPIQAAILQISPAELRDLPEGIREEATAICWTSATIANDDRIVSGGKTYRVLKISDRSEVGNYYRAILGQIDD